MIKRGTTPVVKDRFPRNSSNANKPLKDVKNIPSKPSLARNSASSLLMLGPLVTEPVRCNPESADKSKSKSRQMNQAMRKLVI